MHESSNHLLLISLKLLPLIPKTCQPFCASNDLALTRPKLELLRGQGIGSSLLQAIEKQAIQNQRHHIALTCLLDRVPFYEKNGYVNQGIAASAHAGEVWYNMTKLLPSQPHSLG